MGTNPEPRSALLTVASDLRLRPCEGERDVEASWPWYQDLATVRLVDGAEGTAYDRPRVVAMYESLSRQGELYMVEQRAPSGEWDVVGDVTLAPHTLPIVIRPQSRGHGIGRLVLERLIERAKELGWAELQVRSIEPGNVASRALFRAVGFQPVAVPPPEMILALDRSSNRR